MQEKTFVFTVEGEVSVVNYFSNLMFNNSWSKHCLPETKISTLTHFAVKILLIIPWTF